MKVIKFVILIFAVVLVSCSNETDRILQEHYKARGGDEIKKVKSIQAEGFSMAMMMHLPFTMNFVIPSKLRYDFTLMGKKSSSIFNGDQIWMVQDTVITEVPQPMVAEYKRDMGYQTKIFKSDLIDYYINKQGDVKFLGKDTAEKKEFYKIRLYKDSIEYIFWLDTKTYLEYKLIINRNVKGKKITETTKYSDYKKENNLMIPHMVSVGVVSGNEMPKPESSLMFKKYTINPQINESIFQPTYKLKDNTENTK